MFRFIVRIWLSILLYLLRRQLDRSARKGGPRSFGGGAGPTLGESPRGARDRARVGKAPPIDRSDAVDVPYVEIPKPNDPASGPAGGAAGGTAGGA